MLRTLIVLLLLWQGLPAYAWNRAGHLVSGAITYDVLKRSNPARLEEWIRLLQQHPAYPIWKSTASEFPTLELGKVLFMQAAVFPDDARRGQFKDQDRPDWHYVNFPFVPGQPLADVHAANPFNGRLIVALHESLAALRNHDLPQEQRAQALCWVLHLIGDLHQPLHVTALVNADFPAGDRGGNDVYVRGSERATQPVKLHFVWDAGVDGRTINTRQAANLAADLQKRLSHVKSNSIGSEEQQIMSWIAESYDLAAQAAYLNGKLDYSKESSDAAATPVLPVGYTKRLKAISETQIIFAGQRAALVLGR